MDLENIVIDISQKNHITIPSIQCDSNIRFIVAKIVNNSKKVDVTNYRVTIACKKPDGKIILNDCEKLESKLGLVRFEVTEQIGLVAGTVECELRIYGVGNACLTTQPFVIEVTEPILDAIAVVSSNEFRALTKAMSEVEDMNIKFEQKYNEVTTQFNDKYQEVDNQFSTKFNEINQQFNDKSTVLDTQFANKMTSITNEFDTKSTNLDNQFKQKYDTISTQFQQKYDGLENQYAVNLTGKVDKTEVDVNPTPNKIVKRDTNGNISTRQKVAFHNTSNAKVGEIEINPTTRKLIHQSIPSGSNNPTAYDIHTQQTLPFQTGEFTPRLDGTTSGSMELRNAKGDYTRIGNVVNINMEFTIWGRGNAAGLVAINGLPFASASNTAGKSLSVGWVDGLPNGVYILAYVHAGARGVRLCQKNITTGAMSYVSIDGAATSITPNKGSVIAISGTYTINQ